MVFDRIQSGIIIIDPVSHTIVDINNHAEALLGLKRKDTAGKICHETICPAHKGACPITDLKTPLLDSKRIMISKSGERIPVLKTVAEAIIEGKTYLIESFIDIRDRKAAEDRKVALLAYLNESILRVRTPLELTSQNLSMIAGQVVSRTYNAEDIRSQIMIQAKNISTMASTLEELAKNAREDTEDIPKGYRKFLAGE
ncbi:MAG: PAS domain-containing protein [Methanoregula sp.]|jgi:PAS domain S-box-containing protein